MENVSPILAPDTAAMLQHLGFLFGRALTGRIEITSIHIDKAAKHGARTRFFDCDALEDAAQYAAEINASPGWNTYVGAALRVENVFPGKAAEDDDFLKVYALWADADDGEQVTRANKLCRTLGVLPPMVVITGRTPSKRAQLWWPLDTPLEDIAALRASVRGIAAILGTDGRVLTGKQLMRLGGTVNWPKKDDRVLERTEIIIVEKAAREFSLEQLNRAFPPLDRIEGDAAGITDITVVQGGVLGLEEVVMDGREAYAFRLVRAHLREFLGTQGVEPTPDELYRLVAPIYLKKADQVRPGRGPEFLKTKCIEALRAFAAGQIPGMRDLEEAVLDYAGKHPGPVENTDPEEIVPREDQDEPFPASVFTGEPPDRRWVVKDWIVEGSVNSLYGDGGVGKTLLAQQLACSVAHGTPWLGLETAKGSVLAILCEDERDELHRRHNDIKSALGYAIGNPFEDVLLWPRVGADNQLIRWDRDSKPTLGAFAQRIESALNKHRPALLILDTLADFYGGNEIDRPQVNYFVKTVLGGFIKNADHMLTILLLGHPSVAGKASGSGYSGSTAWNASVRSRLYLMRPEDGPNDERILTRGKANYAASGDETALRLFYAEGVLHAQSDAEDGDALLWNAKRELTDMVEKAWNAGSPFSAQKAHSRFIYRTLPDQLSRAGYAPNIVRQAIREAVDDGQIKVSKSDSKRGYRAD